MAKKYHLEMPAMPEIPSMPEIDMPAFNVVVRSAARSGLVVENLTHQLGEYFGVKNGEGVLVRSVEKGSPAEAAGFRAGDVIVRVAQDRVTDASDWTRAMRAHRTGTVEIGIVRDKREQKVSITLPERKTKPGGNGGAADLRIAVPEVDLDLDLDMEQLRAELARIRPQIDAAMVKAREQMKSAGDEIDRVMREHAADVQIEINNRREIQNKHKPAARPHPLNNQQPSPQPPEDNLDLDDN
jgi:membrane-associated protease RseP (regulator of RpoE activity)